MKLDLSEISQRPGMRVVVDVDQPCVEEADFGCAEPVRGQLTFVNGGDLLLIDGSVRTTVELPCDRCLEAARLPMEAVVEERFPLAEVMNPRLPTEEDAEFDNTLATVIHLEAGKPILNLDELIRQQLVINLPIQILCDPACRGLCVHCGANLNQGDCACEPDEADSPLSGLAALLHHEENGHSP
jgi:DUF177 domain-containing protein